MVAFLHNDALYCRMNINRCTACIGSSTTRNMPNHLHTDYLGALLNLGIERSKIDLAVTDDSCLIFCHADMSDFYI